MKKLSIVKSFHWIIPFLLSIPLFLLFGFYSSKDKTENLLGISFNYDKSEVTIVVVSNGCTQKNDFTFLVNGNKLTINRKKADNCKMVPHAASFTYSLKAVGINADKKYTLQNKIIANPNIAALP